MTASASVGARVRLFLALRLPGDVVDALVAWQERELPERIVPAGNLHVTVAFLGSRPERELPQIVDELRRAARRARRPTLAVAGYRETRSVGMLVLGDEGGRAAALALDVHERAGRRRSGCRRGPIAGNRRHRSRVGPSCSSRQRLQRQPVEPKPRASRTVSTERLDPQ